jgi:molecular chaperone GrpE (heat shock protein)
MRPEGQPFDPNLHEAVMREATDEYPEAISRLTTDAGLYVK